MSYLDAIKNIAADPQDQAAWHSLWESSHAHWFGITYSILGSADKADDAIQNAMLHVRDHASDFTVSGDFAEAQCRAWLNRIVTNSALQLKRSDGRFQNRNQDHGAGMHQQQQADPADTFAQADLLQHIRQQQSHLSDAHQCSLALFYAADLDYEETAAAMSCTVNNARVRVHRALKALRSLLTRAGVSCSVWSVSNALSAQEIPLHLSTIEATVFAQLPAESSAAGILDASLPTGGLSIMAKLSISATIAASLTLGAFGFNQMFAEESKPAPKQIEKVEKQKVNGQVIACKNFIKELFVEQKVDKLPSICQVPFIEHKTTYSTSEELVKSQQKTIDEYFEEEAVMLKQLTFKKVEVASAQTQEKLKAHFEKHNLKLPANSVAIEVRLFLAAVGEEWPIIIMVDKKTNKVNGLFTEQL